MTRKKTKPFNFETALDQLTQLVEKMEQGNLSLEESLKNFETGVGLIRECQQALAETEQKVKILTNSQGKETVAPFEPESSDS